MISPPALGLWCLITRYKCKFRAPGRLLAECPPARPSTLLSLDQALPKAHTLCSPQLECRLGWKEKTALAPTEGGTRNKGLLSLKGGRDAIVRRGVGGAVKKNCSSLAVKRRIIGASGRRRLCHLAYSIPRKSRWVIRRRGRERAIRPLFRLV